MNYKILYHVFFFKLFALLLIDFFLVYLQSKSQPDILIAAMSKEMDEITHFSWIWIIQKVVSTIA